MYYPCSENKGADQFAVTEKLICVFVFPYADCWFSHDTAQKNRRPLSVTLMESMFLFLHKNPTNLDVAFFSCFTFNASQGSFTIPNFKL